MTRDNLTSRGTGSEPVAVPDGDGCDCPICRYVRSSKAAAAAVEILLDQANERDMCLAYLRDEVASVVRSPWAVLVRRRLRHALRVSNPTLGDTDG